VKSPSWIVTFIGSAARPVVTDDVAYTLIGVLYTDGKHGPSHVLSRHTSRTQIFVNLAARQTKYGIGKVASTDMANQWPSIGPHADPRGATRTADHADMIGSNCRDLTVK